MNAFTQGYALWGYEGRGGGVCLGYSHQTRQLSWGAHSNKYRLNILKVRKIAAVYQRLSNLVL
jgi:hypothetical protein